MSKAPFPNEYRVRLVAESDAKACSICYRPCTTVLLNESQLDFLYTCSGHLNDTQFAIPIKLEEYQKLNLQKLELERKIETLQREKELNRPYVWNKLSDYWKSEKPDSGDNKDNGPDKDKDSKPTDKYKAIVSDLKEAETQLADIKSQVENFKFKSYTLHQHFYKSRINAYINTKLNKIKREKITQQDFFPQVPSHNLDS
jgi:hypothetical protein